MFWLEQQLIGGIADGEYQLSAESFGVIGNQDYGELLRTEPLDRLGSAVLLSLMYLCREKMRKQRNPLYEKYLDCINGPP